MVSTGKVVTLRSSDGESFWLKEAVALQSEMIKCILEDDFSDTLIPLPNVSALILAKVIEYSKKHVGSVSSHVDELKSCDAEFVKVDQNTFSDLILAANYLNIKNLLDLTCQAVIDMIKEKRSEEIKKIFYIKKRFHSRGGGRGSQGESMGFQVTNIVFLIEISRYNFNIH